MSKYSHYGLLEAAKMIFLYTWAIGLLTGIVTILIHPGHWTFPAVCQNLLFYQMTVSLTLSGLISFVGHVFKSDSVAESIGWAKGSPFQKELGFAELGYALAGFFCIFHGREFFLAAIVLTSPLYLLAGINHIKEMLVKKNFASHNTWTIIPDLLMPLSWNLLFLFSRGA